MRSNLLSFAPGNQHIPASVASIERLTHTPTAATANRPAFRLLSAEEVKDVPPAELRNHPAVKECLQEYTAMLDRMKDFVKTNADKAAPPWTQGTIDSITADINLFHQKLQQPQGFADLLPVMYGRVKESLHYFEDLLNDKSFSIQKRLNSLQTLAPHLPYCTGAILDTLQRVIAELKGRGLDAAAYLMKRNILTNMAERYVEKFCRKCPAGVKTHAASYLLLQVADEMGIQKSMDDLVMTHGKPYVTDADVKRFRVEVRAMFTPKVLAQGLAEEYQSHVKGGLPKEIKVAEAIPHEQEDAVKENLKRMEHEELIDKYGIVKQDTLFERDWETYQNRFAKELINLRLEFLGKLRREDIVSFDDTVTLDATKKDGMEVKVQMLGNMLWRDTGGNAEELKAADLLKLRPASLLENLKKDSSLKKEKYGEITQDIAQLLSEASYQQDLQIPAEWVRELHSTFAAYLSSEQSQAAMRRLAVQSGATELANQWIEKASKEKLNQQDDYGCTLALLAAKHGRMDTLNLLKQKGAELTLGNVFGKTGVMYAAARGHTDVIKAFMDVSNINLPQLGAIAGANGKADIIKLLDQKGGVNLTPAFVCAVENGHANVIEALKDNKNIKFSIIKDKGNTCAMVAADKGHAAVIKAFATLPGIDFNFFNLKNEAGETAALIAAKNGKAEVIDELKQIEGVDFNLADKQRYKPVTIAAKNGHANVIESLKGIKGVNFNENYGLDPVARLAAQNGHANVIKVLKTIKEVNFVMGPGKSLPVAAAEFGHANVIEELKDIKGIDFNLLFGTVLPQAAAHFAAEKGHAKVIEALKKIDGVDFNIKDSMGLTPLRMALLHGRVDVVRALKDIDGIDLNTGDSFTAMAHHGNVAMLNVFKEIPGIDFNAQDSIGHTLLTTAAQNGHVAFIKALAEIPGIDFNKGGPQGKTAVMFATAAGNVAVIEALGEIRGVDFTLADKQGKTAEMYAVDYRRTDMIPLLKEINDRQRSSIPQKRKSGAISPSGSPK